MNLIPYRNKVIGNNWHKMFDLSAIAMGVAVILIGNLIIFLFFEWLVYHLITTSDASLLESSQYKFILDLASLIQSSLSYAIAIVSGIIVGKRSEKYGLVQGGIAGLFGSILLSVAPLFSFIVPGPYETQSMDSFVSLLLHLISSKISLSLILIALVAVGGLMGEKSRHSS